MGKEITLNNNNFVVPYGTDSAKIIEVIRTETVRGRGTSEDPCRPVVQYWAKDGTFLAEFDCHTGNGENENFKYYGI